ncbi:MAG: zinc-binding dehydrogenase [Chloroflexota bacterium]
MMPGFSGRSGNPLPPTMKALELRSYEGWRSGLKLVQKPRPQPGPGQVLVKIAAAPVNPADIAFMKGQYGVRKALPTVPGWEGSGTVVAAGSGLAARFFVGRRVACAALDGQDGTWAEYMVTSASRCMPLRQHITTEQGAMLLVNPLSAWAMIDLARRGRFPAVAQTAAASALGRMLLRLGRRFGLPMVHIVRRPEQVELLQALGAEYVLSTHQADFDEQLREVCQRLRVTLALDAVAGEMTGRLLQAMPGQAQVIVYGTLSNSASQIQAGRLIFKKQQISGFWLSQWLAQAGWGKVLYAGWQVQSWLGDELKTEVQARLPLAEARRGLDMYVGGMTRGKVLFVPESDCCTSSGQT